MTTALTADPSWSLGTLIWLPIAALVILAAGAAGVICIFGYRNESRASSYYSNAGEYIFFAAVAFGLALLFAGGTAAGMYPYKAEYHQWSEVSGTVEKIDSRLIGSGSGMEDKFVIRFAESGEQYACDDTRCAQVEVGDDLTLSCKRAWQFTGTDGYDCRFVATEVA